MSKYTHQIEWFDEEEIPVKITQEQYNKILTLANKAKFFKLNGNLVNFSAIKIIAELLPEIEYKINEGAYFIPKEVTDGSPHSKLLE